jgi:hypothetical protein
MTALRHPLRKKAMGYCSRDYNDDGTFSDTYHVNRYWEARAAGEAAAHEANARQSAQREAFSRDSRLHHVAPDPYRFSRSPITQPFSGYYCQCEAHVRFRQRLRRLTTAELRMRRSTSSMVLTQCCKSPNEVTMIDDELMRREDVRENVRSFIVKLCVWPMVAVGAWATWRLLCFRVQQGDSAVSIVVLLCGLLLVVGGIRATIVSVRN